jgi:hypothetical protein
MVSRALRLRRRLATADKLFGGLISIGPIALTIQIVWQAK